MKLILLSGGSGKRLWPLSNGQRSKQFIKILNNNRNVGLESMVQRVWRQLEEVGLKEDTFIATGEDQRSILKAQLDIEDSKIILEPSRRDTFAAIALSASYLYTNLGISKDETIVVLPVDPYVDISFFEKIKELDDLIEETKAEIGLIGVKPTIPSEKYGYIIPEIKKNKRVKGFKEKPNSSLAKIMISNGALWNAGVFAFKLGKIIDVLSIMNINYEYSYLYTHYGELPKNSFDYEIIEKETNISYLLYDSFWKDLGTWNTLTEEMGNKQTGFISEVIDSKNTSVINELNTPVAVIGVKDIVIATGSEGILIADKKESHRVKELSSSFFSSIRYMEEEWGNSSILLEKDGAKITQYEINNNKVIKLKLNLKQRLMRISGRGNIEMTNGEYTITGYSDFKFIIIVEGD